VHITVQYTMNNVAWLPALSGCLGYRASRFCIWGGWMDRQSYSSAKSASSAMAAGPANATKGGKEGRLGWHKGQNSLQLFETEAKLVNGARC
jgi:hypothetical protein